MNQELSDSIPVVRRNFYVIPVAFITVVGFVALLLWRSVFVVVLPGETGVLYELLFDGTQTTKVYHEGLVIKLPWNRFYTYNTRLQKIEDHISGLSKEGMIVTVDSAIFFEPKKDNVGWLHKDVGPNYINKIIKPLVVSTIREVLAHYDSHELYTNAYNDFTRDIQLQLANHSVTKYVNIYRVVVRRIALPEKIQEAIEHKLRQEQIAHSYQFMLISQKHEAERKKIEAEGIQKFYETVGSSLTPELLTWRGIEATVEFARSPNAKIVVVGSNKNQMPLILGGEIGSLPGEASAKSTKKDIAQPEPWSEDRDKISSTHFFSGSDIPLIPNYEAMGNWVKLRDAPYSIEEINPSLREEDGRQRKIGLHGDMEERRSYSEEQVVDRKDGHLRSGMDTVTDRQVLDEITTGGSGVHLREGESNVKTKSGNID